MLNPPNPRITTTRYPWDRWLGSKRKKFKLVRGIDYFCMDHSMAAQIRNAASKRNVLVSVHIGDNELDLMVRT